MSLHCRSWSMWPSVSSDPPSDQTEEDQSTRTPRELIFFRVWLWKCRPLTMQEVVHAVGIDTDRTTRRGRLDLVGPTGVPSDRTADMFLYVVVIRHPPFISQGEQTPH